MTKHIISNCSRLLWLTGSIHTYVCTYICVCNILVTYVRRYIHNMTLHTTYKRTSDSIQHSRLIYSITTSLLMCQTTKWQHMLIKLFSFCTLKIILCMTTVCTYVLLIHYVCAYVCTHVHNLYVCKNQGFLQKSQQNC